MQVHDICMNICDYRLFCFSDDVKGILKLWIIGDNFVATSIRNYFKKATFPSFIKDNFHWEAFCSSRFNDKNTNMLSRLQNTFALAVDKSERQPEYILVILDDDLISYLDFKGLGFASMISPWCEWLVQTIGQMIAKRADLLSKKALVVDGTQIYWTSATRSMYFKDGDDNSRMKFNNCMELVVKPLSNMRRIMLKEHWLPDSSNMI